MEIIYLLNSGFLLRMGDTVLIFDDYRDPAGAVERELQRPVKPIFLLPMRILTILMVIF